MSSLNISDSISPYLLITIFILIYVFIAVQRFPFIKIDRPAGAFTGVTLLILAGLITLQESYSFINFDVITFLLGMMIMVAYLQISGFFQLAAYNMIKICNTPNRFLIGVISSSATLSALFVNDTICLLFTPIILDASKRLKINPIPYLFAIAFSSNIGSALTVTGNPQNMYIGVVTSISYLKFASMMALPVIVSLIALYLMMKYIYRRELKSFGVKTATVKDYEVDMKLMIKSFIALAVTLILFVLNIGYPLAALIGATVIILLAQVKPAKAFSKIDWPILILFAGLFIIMGSFEKAGYMNSIIATLNEHTENISLFDATIFSSVVILLSNLVSNLPSVILLIPIAEKMGGEFGGVLLASVSTFAGNLTLIGSVATLIVAYIAGEEGVRLKFSEHLKVGIPITLFSSCFVIIWSYFIYFKL